MPCFQINTGHDNINPLKVDVTKNDDSIDAAATVSKWLEDKSQSKKRVLHSIVNNAGIGNIGLIDWLDLSTFRKVMDGAISSKFCVFCVFYSIKELLTRTYATTLHYTYH